MGQIIDKGENYPTVMPDINCMSFEGMKNKNTHFLWVIRKAE